MATAFFSSDHTRRQSDQTRWWRWVRRAIYIAFWTPVIYLLMLPNVRSLRTKNPTQTTLMALREKQARAAGRPIHIVFTWKNIDQISPHLAHAVLLSEDDMFYEHNGFDLEQIQIALQRDWDQKKYVYGGSTITQQLARSLYLSPRKNLLRKAKEALITILLEHYLSKKRIMELYLNVVEWGPGIFGAEAAAQSYFQKPAKDLNPDEAVALASILPSPRRWSPVSERTFMARRRTRLYARMRSAGFLPAPPNLGVPAEIEQMAIQGNVFLQHQQEEEENHLQPPPSESDADENADGLMIPTHPSAPPKETPIQ